MSLVYLKQIMDTDFAKENGRIRVVIRITMNLYLFSFIKAPRCRMEGMDAVVW